MTCYREKTCVKCLAGMTITNDVYTVSFKAVEIFSSIELVDLGSLAGNR